VRGEGES